MQYDCDYGTDERDKRAMQRCCMYKMRGGENPNGGGKLRERTVRQ